MYEYQISKNVYCYVINNMQIVRYAILFYTAMISCQSAMDNV